MLYFLGASKMKIKFEDIAIFVLLGAALAVILWLLHGSPTLENGIISIGTFIISSVVLLWRKYYQIDSNMKVSFNNVKNDMTNLQNHIDNKLEKIEELLKNGR